MDLVLDSGEINFDFLMVLLCFNSPFQGARIWLHPSHPRTRIPGENQQDAVLILVWFIPLAIPFPSPSKWECNWVFIPVFCWDWGRKSRVDKGDSKDPWNSIASTGKKCLLSIHGKALWKLLTVTIKGFPEVKAETNQCSPNVSSGQQSSGVSQQEEERLDCIFQQMISTQKIERALLNWLPNRFWSWPLEPDLSQKHETQVTQKI